jgi:hypothetical protein
MAIVIISLNIMAFILGFGIGTYIYHKVADGNK